MAHTVGLEFGTDFVRLCHVELSAKGYKILHLRQLEFVKDPPEKQGNLLKELFQGIPKDQVFLSLSSDSCIFRLIQVPFSDPEQIRKIIKFEAETHIHSCPIEDILVDFQKIDEEERPQLFLAGFYKKDLQTLLEPLHTQRIYPFVADLDICHLIHTLLSLNYVQPEESYLIFEVEEHSSKILLVDQGKLIQIRVLRFGLNSLQNDSPKIEPIPLEKRPEFLMGDFLISPPFLEEDAVLKPDEQELFYQIQKEFAQELQFARIEDLLNKMVKETSRTMAALSFKKNPEKIFLFCQQKIPNAIEYLQENFEMEVIQPQLFDKVTHQLDKESLQKIPIQRVLGAALRPRSPSSLKMNFLQEEFQSVDRFELLKKPLMLLFFLLFFLFFSSGLFWRYRAVRLAPKLSILNSKAMTLLETWAPDQAKRVKDLTPENQLLGVKNRLNSYLEDLLFLQSGGTQTEFLPVFTIWRTLFLRLRQIRPRLSEFRISLLLTSQREIRLQGWVAQEPEVQLLIDTLKQELLFENVQLEGSLQRREGVVPFKLRILFSKKN